MYISLDWVKDFVDLPKLDADDLANAFTMTTAEVEDVTTTNEHLNVIVVAQIKSVQKHPEADKLNLVTFETGQGTREVVCGAPNVREGLKVPYAKIGVTLPGGFTLEPKKIRGVLSEGMLCSEKELGLGEGTSGLMELTESAKVGMTLSEHLGIRADIVLDVDNKSLTHRPDLWGHYGIAREFAAAYELPLKNKYDTRWAKALESKFTNEKSPVRPEVDLNSSCLAFWGLSVDGVKVEASPQWMQDRLNAAGMRPINNIVDISNYVMLELGNPLHIYDRESLTDSRIVVKKAGSELEFVTLDEMNRKIIAEDTLISDGKKPVVLAGVMGGLNSGVKDETTKVFIEVANWRAEEVRKTSTRLGLRTDSSQRYEKSLDSKQCYRTLLRTLDLILELCPKAKVVGKPEYDGHKLEDIKPLVVKTSGEKIRKVLGYPVTNEKLNKIFTSLEFDINQSEDQFTLTLPTFRTTKDLEGEADIIEEVGRIIGYDNIASVSPTTDIFATRLDNAKTVTRKVQDFMSLHGKSLEVMTYPLIGKKLLEKVSWPVCNEELVLVNALSTDADRMRPSLIPHALNTVAVNARNFKNYSFFELGRSYLANTKSFSEERHQLVIGMFNKSETPFVELINQFEALMGYLKIPYTLEGANEKFQNPLVSNQWIGLHPHEYLNVRVMGKFQGTLFSVHPLMMRNIKAKGFCSFAVIDLTDVMAREVKDKMSYKPISKFPSSSFDCTVLVDKGVHAASTLEALKKLKLNEMTDRRIVDVFDLNEKQNAVTISVILEDPNKTLDPGLIKKAENDIVATLEKAGFPLKV